MLGSAWCRSLASVLALLGSSTVARAESVAQTELTWLLRSGQASFAFDELGSRRSGRESTLRFGSRLERAGYLPGVRSAALLALDLQLDQPEPSLASLRDASSYLSVSWQRGTLELGLRAYPFDSDTWRLGYLHALDWGGSDAEHRQSIFVDQESGVPAAVLGARWSAGQLFSGVKWARARPSVLETSERRWGFLSGGSFELAPRVRFDAGFGAFERAPASHVEGLSFRAVWHDGIAEPQLAPEPFRPPSLREEALLLGNEPRPGAALALEGTALVQRAPRRLLAPGAALYGSVHNSSLGLHAVLAWRSAAWLTRNSRVLLDGEAQSAARTRAELSGWLGGNVRLPAQLSPSLELGLLLPATLQSPSALPGLVQTFVVRESGDISALPVGSDRVPVFAARAALRWDASSALLLALFATYERDSNRVGLRDTSGALQRVFERPDRLEAALAARASF